MDKSIRFLTALPVFNEVDHVSEVLDHVTAHADDVLVVDDGSSDGTSDLVTERTDISCVRHSENRGYGAALITAFDYAVLHAYDVIVTIDCDGQHEPQRIRSLVDACEGYDIVSGSRYLAIDQDTAQAPPDRRRVNEQITADLNQLLGLSITDAFCGFKSYRVASLAHLSLTEPGYAMPLELWVQAVKHELRIREVSVPLIYLDEKRSFGGNLDDSQRRLKYYEDVLNKALETAGIAIEVDLTK